MRVDKEIIVAVDTLEKSGLSKNQLSSIHHFSLKGRKIGFPLVRDYFTEGKELREANSQFAQRLLFIRDKHQETGGNFDSLCKRATEQFPFEPDLPDSDEELIIDEVIEDSLVTMASLERDLHTYLANRINEIEDGLTLVKGGSEYHTNAGRIDLLSKDAKGNTVVIELKAGIAKDNAMGQLLGYMGCISAETNSNVRGILVASDFDTRVEYAAQGLDAVKLVKYQLSFQFDVVQ